MIIFLTFLEHIRPTYKEGFVRLESSLKVYAETAGAPDDLAAGWIDTEPILIIENCPKELAIEESWYFSVCFCLADFIWLGSGKRSLLQGLTE